MQDSSSKAEKGHDDSDGDALDPLSERALEWLVLLHSGEETEQDWQAYEHWKTADPAHAAACTQAEALWASIGPAVRRPRLKKAATRVLSVLLLVSGLVVLLMQAQVLPSATSLMAAYRTPIDDGRQITLDDGSQLQMDANTQLDVAFTDDLRQVTLYGGQVHIAVAPDTSRPFEVIASDVIVRALGTAFNVRVRRDAVDVLVTEHAVSVRAHPESDAVIATTQVEAGQGLRYSRESGISPAAPMDVNTRLAWRRGRLIFNDQPLYQVLQDIQPYTGRKIVVLKAGVKQRHVTG
ncbi:MAG TPA: hypothetical protein DD979_15220, partial [Gammaproteobacteria bacterium]|nr:hypothetical protein [Gammaproteobacteria bacterium]